MTRTRWSISLGPPVRLPLVLFAAFLMLMLAASPASAFAPSRPRSVEVAVGSESIEISWRRPVLQGGAGPVSYEVVLEADGGEVDRMETGDREATLDRPEPGQYRVRVRALNRDGASRWVDKSIVVAGVPTAPEDLEIELDDEEVKVEWRRPRSDGGAEISGYRLSFDGRLVELNAGRRSYRLFDVDRGTHTVEVRAANEIGVGPAAVLSFDTTIAPGAVRSVSAAVDGSQVSVRWSAPIEDGGGVTGYEVQVGSSTAETGGRVAVFEALPSGDYSVRVRAVNGAGPGPWTSGGTVRIARQFEPFTDADAFVTQAYADFLGRRPDEAGLDYWNGQLGGPEDMASVVIAFSRAPELDAERRLARLYLALFDRAPDRGGFDYWVDELEGGRPLPAIAEEFVGSAEFLARFGALDNGEFVVLVYNRVLARTPDQAGFSHWVDQLDRGLGRGELIALFSEAPEFVAKSGPAVDLIVTYDGLLQRPPTPDELSRALVVVAEGSFEAVVTNIIASDEYRRRLG